MDILGNVLIGIVSGLISSWMITQLYREIDKKKERLEYVTDLLAFSKNFEKNIHRIGPVDIEDEYVTQLRNFVTSNYLPSKKKWVKLKREEKQICNNFINFYNQTLQEIMVCYLDMVRNEEDKKKYITQIENAKLKFCTVYALEATLHVTKLLELRNKYVK